MPEFSVGQWHFPGGPLKHFIFKILLNGIIRSFYLVVREDPEDKKIEVKVLKTTIFNNLGSNFFFFDC